MVLILIINFINIRSSIRRQVCFAKFSASTKELEILSCVALLEKLFFVTVGIKCENSHSFQDLSYGTSYSHIIYITH